MKRRLLLLTVVALAGYGIGWSAHAYGWPPLLLLTLVAAVSWLAGATWTTSRTVIPLTIAVAEAHRERDEIAARLAQLEDGGTYTPVKVTELRPRVQIVNCDGLVHTNNDLMYVGPCDKQSCRIPRQAQR